MGDGSDFNGVTFEELTAAFLHPPRIVPVGYLHVSDEGDRTVISHVELWPWRVVVAGCRTRRADDLDALNVRLRHPPPPIPPFGVGQPGTVGGVIVTLNDGSDGNEETFRPWRERIEADIEWYSHWTISDDVDTAYWFVGSPRQQRERIEDFAIERHPAPPAAASLLTIGTPFDDQIQIALGDANAVTVVGRS